MVAVRNIQTEFVPNAQKTTSSIVKSASPTLLAVSSTVEKIVLPVKQTMSLRMVNASHSTTKILAFWVRKMYTIFQLPQSTSGNRSITSITSHLPVPLENCSSVPT